MDIKILVISDSHGDFRSEEEAIDREAPFDILVHCGDSEGSLYSAEEQDKPFQLYAVKGNCDGSGYPEQITFKTGYYDILVVHGHRQRASISNLLQAARKNYADIVLYGHTHIPSVIEKDGVLLVNPGSISEPRQAGRRRSYAVLTVSEDYLPAAEIKYLDF